MPDSSRASPAAHGGAPALTLALLGSFEARLRDTLPVRLCRRKSEALLAYLAMPTGRMHRRDMLATLLWGDTSDARARHSLRQALLTLRQALATTPATLRETGDTVGLDPASVAVDVAALEGAAATQTPDALERAAALYRGDLLEGIVVTEPAFEAWLRSERERLRELAIESLTRLLGHHARGGATDRAVQVGVRLLALEPAHEAAHRILMRLYAGQGRRGAALRQYETCSAALARELGVEPERETRDLYRALVGAAPAASPRVVTPL